MARAVTSQLIMELLDRVTGPARKVAGSMRGLNRTAKETSTGQVTLADRVASAQARSSASLDRARVGVLETVGTYYLLRDAVAAPIRAAADFETALEDIGQKAGIPQEKLGALGEEIKTVARETNQATSSISAAIDALVGRGADTDVALAAAAPIGKAATAYRASTDDLASAAWAAVDNLKVPADQIGTAMDMMAQAGKEGAFELRDMAQYFPALGAAYQGLGQEGVDSVADLAAALQVVRKGTGDSSSAATNLSNVLQKIYAPATVKKFGEKNIDIYKAMEKAAKRGLTPIEAIAEITNEALDGDLSKLGTLFEDAQVQAGLRAIIQNMGEYRRIRDEAMKAQGTVDADYERRTRTAAGAMARWEASMENLKISLGNSLLPVLNDVLDKIIPIIDNIGKWIEANPELAGGIATAVTGLVALRGAVSLLSFGYLIGKGGALALAAAGFKLLGTEAGASALAVETAAGRIRRASLLGSAGRLAAKAAPWLAVASLSGDTPAKSPEEQVSFDESKDRLSKIADLNAAEVALEAASKVQELRAKQDELLTAIQEGGTSESVAMDLSRQLLEVEAELATAEDAAAGTKDALAAIGMTSVSPTIDAASIEAALTKTRQLRADLLRINAAGGSAQAGVPIKGPRAKGGPISRGNTYLVGEDGPELMTATKSGYIHPNGKGFGGGFHLTAHLCLPRADHGGGHMRQGGKVARGPHGPLRRNDGRDPPRQHVLQQRNHLPPHARGPAPQRQEFQHHHQPRHIARHGFAHTAAMRQDQVFLKRFRALRCDLQGCQLAKAGVHPIDRRRSGRRLRDAAGSQLHPRAGAVIQAGGGPRAVDPLQLRQRHRAGDQGLWFRRQGGLR